MRSAASSSRRRPCSRRGRAREGGGAGRATVRGTAVRWVARRALSIGRRYVYVVTAEDALGRSSGPSDRLVIPYLAAPRAPRSLSASPGDRRVSLTWQPPAELVDGSPAPGDLRNGGLGAAGGGGAPSATRPKPG